MDFLEATKGVFRSTRLVYWSVVNKIEILRSYRAAAIPGTLEHHRWNDLLIRNRWCTNYLGDAVRGDVDRGLSNLISRCILYTSGEIMQDIRPLRITTPISFTSEPCAMCKALEASFTPNDGHLRNTSINWVTRYKNLLQALISDSYKIHSAGNYYYAIINSYRDTLTGNTPAGYPYSDCFKMWDIGMETSRRFLDTGRNCYSLTERVTREKIDNIQHARRENIGIDLDHKFATTDSSVLKSEGGLFALNTELLCSNCKDNVEADPVEVEL